jgi:hypothetical protein
MNNLSITLSPIFLLAACGNQQQAGIDITNEISNEITVENGCCCGDPCDGDDTGSPEPTEVHETFEYTVCLEVEQVDVAFLMDTTGSMGEVADAMADEFDDIVDALALSIPDGAYGYGTYEDYNYSTTEWELGINGDLPFTLRQQITTEPAPVQAAMVAVDIGHGGWWHIEESTMEALFQALTGQGYDQNGDGELNTDTDVPPFISSAGDVFSGAEAGTQDPSTVGSGQIGGFGFRDGSLPVVVYATDATLRDPDAGYLVPGANAAGSDDVINAVANLGARLIGIGVDSEYPGGPVSQDALDQMVELAYATDSLYDPLELGSATDPLVFHWTGTGTVPTFQETIVDAIEGMLDGVEYETVTAEVVGLSSGFTAVVSPPSQGPVIVGSTPECLDFVVEITGSVPASTEEQSFPMTLEITGDGTTLLGTEDLTVTVPASL